MSFHCIQCPVLKVLVLVLEISIRRALHLAPFWLLKAERLAQILGWCSVFPLLIQAEATLFPPFPPRWALRFRELTATHLHPCISLRMTECLLKPEWLLSVNGLFSVCSLSSAVLTLFPLGVLFQSTHKPSCSVIGFQEPYLLVC